MCATTSPKKLSPSFVLIGLMADQVKKARSTKALDTIESQVSTIRMSPKQFGYIKARIKDAREALTQPQLLLTAPATA